MLKVQYIQIHYTHTQNFLGVRMLMVTLYISFYTIYIYIYLCGKYKLFYIVLKYILTLCIQYVIYIHYICIYEAVKRITKPKINSILLSFIQRQKSLLPCYIVAHKIENFVSDTQIILYLYTFFTYICRQVRYTYLYINTRSTFYIHLNSLDQKFYYLFYLYLCGYYLPNAYILQQEKLNFT